MKLTKVQDRFIKNKNMVSQWEPILVYLSIS